MRNRRAIVVDDDEHIAVLFRHFLSGLGYDVLTFTEPVICPIYAAKALSCSQQRPCADIVITDYQMPGMTGLELLQAQAERGCRLTPQNKALLSGYIDPEKISAIRRLGCAFFEKPVRLVELEDWIRTCEQRMDLKEPLGDRRKERRSPAPGPLPYVVRCADDTVRCCALNVSDEGFCLKMPVPVQPAQVLHITPPAQSGTRAAVVRWISRQHDGSYMTGLSCC